MTTRSSSLVRRPLTAADVTTEPPRLGSLAVPVAVRCRPAQLCGPLARRSLQLAASPGRRTATSQDRLDARGPSEALKWVQFVGRFRVLGVYTRMTTTGSINTNTADRYTQRHTR
jgi:hypothetical protein